MTKEQLRTLLRALSEALREDEASGGGLRHTHLALIRSGVSVLVHGRPRPQAIRAGTKRWLIELELFPICIVEEGDDRDPHPAMKRAIYRFLTEANRYKDD